MKNKERKFWFKKKHQKTFLLWAMGVDEADTHVADPKIFFGSFFQKRNLFS